MRIGRYNVVSLLGHGAHGEVFHARLDGPMGFRKDVALKRIHPHLVRGNPAVVQALVDEARLGGLLRHPNIVESHEFEQDEGTWFLAMEYVDGLTLHQLAALGADAGRPALPPDVVFDIIEQICEGLQYAHTLRAPDGTPLRVVHRDMKPANLMVSREGVLKIMDFGMAKAASNLREHTTTGTIKGTPAYMSPEQVQGNRAVSEASDLFAVGVILFELLTGTRLFDGETAVAVMFAVINGVPPARIAEVDAKAPGVGRIFARCIAPDPADRWQSAAELARAIRALRERYDEPPGALRALAVSLLQGRERIDPDDLSRRSESFTSWLDTVDGSPSHLRLQQPQAMGADSDASLEGAPGSAAGPSPDATWAGDDEPAASSAAASGGGTQPAASPDATWAGDGPAAAGPDATWSEPAPAPLPEPSAAPLPPAAPAPPAATVEAPPESAPARRSPLLPALGGLGLVALLGVGLWAGFGGGSPPPDPAASQPEAAGAALPAEAPALPAGASGTASSPGDAPPPVVAEPAPASASDPPTGASRGPPSPAGSTPTSPTSAASTAAETSSRGRSKPPATEAPAAAADAAPKPAGEGSVLVKASPWGRVTIDGKASGQTPLRTRLPSGKHTIRVECGECPTAASETRTVDVPVDGLETITVSFAP